MTAFSTASVPHSDRQTLHGSMMGWTYCIDWCRMEETLLGVYGADGLRGAGKERIQLQSEMNRATDQVAFP